MDSAMIVLKFLMICRPDYRWTAYGHMAIVSPSPGAWHMIRHTWNWRVVGLTVVAVAVWDCGGRREVVELCGGVRGTGSDCGLSGGVGGGAITPTELGCKCPGACPAGWSGSEWRQWEMEVLVAMVVGGGGMAEWGCWGWRCCLRGF